MLNNNYQKIKYLVSLKTAKNCAKIYNLMCNIICRNKAQLQQRRFFVSLTASCLLHIVSTILKFDYELNSALSAQDYN